MKSVVTGGSGFIGSHLCEKLIQEGHQVLAIDNLCGGKLTNLDSIADHPNFSFAKADIRSFSEIEAHFKDADYVFHLAALADIVPSIENPKGYFETNVTGTYNVLESVKKHSIKKLVYAASSSCYGIPNVYPTPETTAIAPKYPYALTKFLGEELVMHWGQVYKIPVISLRLFNVYGPRARTAGTYGAAFGVFLAQKLNKKPFTIVGDGKQTRDFTFVTDVADAFYTASISNIAQEIMNVGSGGHYSVNEIIELLKGDKVFIPKRPGEPDCTFADINKIQNKLGWSAKVPLKEGVNRLISQIDDFKDAPVWDLESIDSATKNWFKYLK